MKTYSLKAIFLGFLSGIVTYTILAIVIIISHEFMLTFIRSILLRYSSLFSTVTTGITMIISFITSGFVAGRLVAKKKVAHGFLTGILFFIFGIVMISYVTLSESFYNTAWQLRIAFYMISTLSFPSLGSYIALKQHQRKELLSHALDDQKIKAFGKNQEE